MIYYNEFDPFAAEWLRQLMNAGLIPQGDIDTRSITEVKADEIRGYTQCHFFAGIGGWAYAARLAGWPDDRPIWTGSCPCQPFSTAGKQKGMADERHLWPVWFDLIRACAPPVVMGEQVAAAIGKDWLDRVYSDLEGEGYACGSAVLPACAVNAPHRRDRLWFVADALNWIDATIVERSNVGGYENKLPNDYDRGEEMGGTREGSLAHSERTQAHKEQRGPEGNEGRWETDMPRGRGPHQGEGSGNVVYTIDQGSQGHAGYGDKGDQPRRHGSESCRSVAEADIWSDCGWIIGADQKARRVKPGICLLADGVPARVGKLRAFGNAIVPQVAAEVIGAFMEC